MNLRPFLGPALSGVLVPLAFPSFVSTVGFFPLGLVGLAPLILFASERRAWGQLVAGHLIFSLLHFGLVVYWIPRVLVVYGQMGWFAAAGVFLLLLLSQALLVAPFTLGVGWMAQRSRAAALAAAPGLWLFTELLRNELPFGGFPWAALGYSQVGFSWLAQSADVGGVYALSFLLVTVNALVAVSWKLRRWRPALLALALVTLPVLYGVYRTAAWDPEVVGSKQVGLVQGNLAQFADREYYAAAYFEELPRLFDRAVAGGADWVILPEAQNPYHFGEDFYYTNFWRAKAEQAGVWLLFNGIGAGDDTAGGLRNSAFLLSPEGKQLLRYDKVRLVPFGEYVPMQDWLFFAGSLVDSVSDFVPGPELRLGSVDGLVFAPQICFEALFPWISREAAASGAQLLVSLTNDGWYGSTAAPYQHLAMARMRAIETRRTLVRATNTGVSTLVNPWGEQQESLPTFEAGVLVSEVRFYDVLSPFSVIGNSLDLALIMLTSLLVGWAWRRDRKG